MADTEYRDVLVWPFTYVRVGTIVRVAAALGWDLDDVLVWREHDGVHLGYADGAKPSRPALSVGPMDKIVELAESIIELPADGAPADLSPVPLAAVPDPPPDPLAITDDDIPPTPTCRLCGRRCPSRGEAAVHERDDHTNPDAVSCEQCGWVFVTIRGLRHHWSMMHPPVIEPPAPVEIDPAPDDPPTADETVEPDELLFRCEEPACSFTSEYRVDLTSHTQAAHGRPATRSEKMAC